MSLLLTILIIIVSILLIAVILVQNPKGGGLSSAFGGSAQLLGGVKKTTDILDRSTWTLAIALVVLVLLTNLTGAPSASQETLPESGISEQVDDYTPPPAPQAMPSNTGTAPGSMPEPVDEEEQP